MTISKYYHCIVFAQSGECWNGCLKIGAIFFCVVFLMVQMLRKSLWKCRIQKSRNMSLRWKELWREERALYKRRKHIKVDFQNVRSSGLKRHNKACYKNKTKKLAFKTHKKFDLVMKVKCKSIAGVTFITMKVPLLSGGGTFPI